jgi:predicted component of type VI protein secretion system
MIDSTKPGESIQGSPVPKAQLVILRGPQAGEKILLKPGTNLFGREEGFILQDGRVSRRHAQIQNVQNEFILVDLHSTNGTFVNGDQIHQSVLLQHGDSIRLGDTILTFRLETGEGHDPSFVGARTPATNLDRGDSTLLVGRLFPKQADSNISTEAENKVEKSPPHLPENPD